MIESQALPHELIRQRRDWRDGLYTTSYRSEDEETHGSLLKRGSTLSGGHGPLVCYGRIYGRASVTVHFEVHRRGDGDDTVFRGFEWTTYEMSGYAANGAADLHGFDPEGRELWMTMRSVR
ncbi:hypothetical protein [Pacificimonas flava]|uniref:Uncharacterized protein n=1 Tax=Pacificimonas flava TaxID=1234595 RepID=M2T995_9SPHN|nr:hypothetical protein [Pacificimonas flava]EMD83119.1 hypothetical protein C725_1717 [Pacificimonas flava]MBB5280277.1 hypothetical protein [Pacificimonas flava]